MQLKCNDLAHCSRRNFNPFSLIHSLCFLVSGEKWVISITLWHLAQIISSHVSGGIGSSPPQFSQTIKSNGCKSKALLTPALKLVTPGLSIKVKGVKGPILEEELPRCREFEVRFGGLVKS